MGRMPAERLETLLRDAFPDQGVVPGKRHPHRLPVVLPQRGAAFDIGEQKRHRSDGQALRWGMQV